MNIWLYENKKHLENNRICCWEDWNVQHIVSRDKTICQILQTVPTVYDRMVLLTHSSHYSSSAVKLNLKDGARILTFQRQIYADKHVLVHKDLHSELARSVSVHLLSPYYCVNLKFVLTHSRTRAVIECPSFKHAKNVLWPNDNDVARQVKN